MATDPLPDLGLTLRRPTLEDVEAAAELFIGTEVFDTGEPDTDVAELRDWWRQLDIDADAWLVTDGSGRPVAYGEVSRHRPVQLEGWIVVHPELRRKGIGSSLATLVEARAGELALRAPDGARVVLGGWINAAHEASRGFVGSRGYEPARRFWRMRIDLEEAQPEPPRWPEGIEVRTFEPGHDERTTFEAAEDAFADHWGHVAAEFDDWIKRTHGETFDPALWFLATEDGMVVGTALCTTYSDLGWVGTLGVRRPWRGQGLGTALLRHAFREFHNRGRRTVALGVDSQNVTGATRLYERAGMRVERAYDLCTRVLRDGTDLTAGGGW